jgi:signal peptidase
MPKAFGIADWIGRLGAWLLILGISVTVIVSVLLPRLAGATPYVILTGSMRPAMPPGTLVVVKPVDPDKISIGDVVTYQLESGMPTVVTHRVIAKGIDGRGKSLFQFKGDANNSPDAKWVLAAQIKGERWYYVPYLGYVTSLITGNERHIAIVAVVSFLLLYAVYMFVGAGRDRVRKRTRATTGTMPAPASHRREIDKEGAHV